MFVLTSWIIWHYRQKSYFWHRYCICWYLAYCNLWRLSGTSEIHCRLPVVSYTDRFTLFVNKKRITHMKKLTLSVLLLLYITVFVFFVFCYAYGHIGKNTDIFHDCLLCKIHHSTVLCLLHTASFLLFCFMTMIGYYVQRCHFSLHTQKYLFQSLRAPPHTVSCMQKISWIFL